MAPLVDEYAGDTGARPADDDRIAAVEELREGHEAVVEQVRRFQRALRHGLAWPSGPAEFSGMELPATSGSARRGARGHGFPSREALFVGLNIVARRSCTTPRRELANRVVGGPHRGELIGCQLFSEPGAGSDLASVATRAVREGDEGY